MKTIAPLPLARLDANHTHVEAFKSLAHLSRLQVFFFLVRAGKEMSVGEIQEAVEIPGPTLSHHPWRFPGRLCPITWTPSGARASSRAARKSGTSIIPCSETR